MVELIELPGADAAEVLVSFWGAQENVLEETGGEPGTGRITEEGLSGTVHASGERYGIGGAKGG